MPVDGALAPVTPEQHRPRWWCDVVTLTGDDVPAGLGDQARLRQRGHDPMSEYRPPVVYGAMATPVGGNEGLVRAEFGRQVAVRNDRHHAAKIAVEGGQQARRVGPEREPDHPDARCLLIVSQPGEQTPQIRHRLTQAEHVVDRVDVGHEHLVEPQSGASWPVEREHGKRNVDPEFEVQTASVRVVDVAQATHVLTVDPDEPWTWPAVVA